jgi:hypothetical protein
MPTIEQKRRSALHSRGCGCLRCSSCGRRQRFSAISITLDLNAVEIARTRKRTTRPSDQSHAEAQSRDCQPRNLWTVILRPADLPLSELAVRSRSLQVMSQVPKARDR